MKIHWLAAAAAISFLSLVVTSDAQVPASGTVPAQPAGAAPSTSATAAPRMDTISLPAWPQASVPLSGGATPVTASFSLGQVADIPPALLAGVTAQGYARQVAVEGQHIGQVLITAVAQGDKVEQIEGQGLTAQFDASGITALAPSKDIQVQGAKSALLTALQKLAATGTKKDTPAAVAGDTKDFTGSSGAPANDLAANWTPPATPAATASTPAAQTTMSVTTAGCSIRIDTSQGMAIQQSKVQTFTNGVLSNDGTCTDSGTDYPIQKDYTVCPDSIDLTAMKATPQYKSYYVDGTGTTNYIDQTCQADTTKYYAITQNYGACNIDVDLPDLEAFRQAQLVYTNGNNAQVVVQQCQHTSDAAIPLVSTATGCPPRIDSTAMLAHEQKQVTYQYNGLTYTPQSCTDDGVTFAIIANQAVCSPLVDQTTGMAYPQQRYQYTDGTGTLQYADSGCSPITGSGEKLQSTPNGCTAAANFIPHLSAGYTNGSSRAYYTSFDGTKTPIYVTACAEDITLQYLNQTEITGYQNDDATLSAQPITDTYIMPPSGKVIVAPASIAAGAPNLPYTLTGTTTVLDTSQQPTYSGCNAYQPTLIQTAYTRPDGTTYGITTGAGTPIGPTNACTTSQTIKSGSCNPTGNDHVAVQSTLQLYTLPTGAVVSIVPMTTSITGNYTTGIPCSCSAGPTTGPSAGCICYEVTDNPGTIHTYSVTVAGTSGAASSWGYSGSPGQCTFTW